MVGFLRSKKIPNPITGVRPTKSITGMVSGARAYTNAPSELQNVNNPSIISSILQLKPPTRYYIKYYAKTYHIRQTPTKDALAFDS